MQSGVESGIILAAGPFVGADGGYVVLRADDEKAASDYLNADPMVQADMQHYELKEFMPLSKAPVIENW